MDKLNATPLDHGLTHALDYVDIFELAGAKQPALCIAPILAGQPLPYLSWIKLSAICDIEHRGEVTLLIMVT
jgi:hypothetical protein